MKISLKKGIVAIFWSSLLIDADTVGSIGSSRRGGLMYNVPKVKCSSFEGLVVGGIRVCVQNYLGVAK